MVWIRRFHRGLFPVSLLFTVLLLVGNSSSAAEDKAGRRITLEELRHEIMRFAGRSSERVDDVYFRLEGRFQTPKARRAALENSAAYVSSSLDIAIAPNPEVNMLDMVVLVALSRIVAEEYWVPQVFGDEAHILVEVFRDLEGEIWSIAAKVLTQQQQQELRGSIRQWRKRNPDRVFVEATRFGDFVGVVGKSELAKARQGGGFLGIKGVTREVSETRLLAERAMFYAQRVPWIARSFARLLVLDVAMAPEINQVMTDTGTLAKAMHQTATFTEQLPELITEQRDQIMKQVTVERKAAIDQLMEGVATERKAVIPQIIEVIDKAAAKGEVLIDHTFWHAVVLIVIFLIGSVLAGLSYRYASERLLRSRQGRGAS